MQQSGNPTNKIPKKTSSEIYWSPKKEQLTSESIQSPKKGTDPWEGKTVKESLKHILVWFKEVLHPPNRNGFLGYHFVTTSPTPTNKCPFGKNRGAGLVAIIIYLLKGVSKQTPLLVNQPMGKTHLHRLHPANTKAHSFWRSSCAVRSASPDALGQGAHRHQPLQSDLKPSPKWSGWCCWSIGCTTLLYYFDGEQYINNVVYIIAMEFTTFWIFMVKFHYITFLCWWIPRNQHLSWWIPMKSAFLLSAQPKKETPETKTKKREFLLDLILRQKAS